MSLGLERAGFDTIAYSEANKSAEATFALNFGSGVEQIGPVERLTDSRIRRLRNDFGRIDLVCGGPPCQGYSGIGHRRTHKLDRVEMPSNHLFKEMVRVIRSVQPRAFLFENVRGLLSGKWTADGEKGEIWREVRETFGGLRGYEIGWKLVHAREYGVPQNRPRIILIGVRRELGVAGTSEDADPVDNGRGLIPPPSDTPPSLVDVLDDLDDPEYACRKVTPAYLYEPSSAFQIAARTTRSGQLLGVGEALYDQEYSRHSGTVTKRFVYMLEHDGRIPPSLRTKKFAQRVLPKHWGPEGPSITATSLPDDYVHYRRPRILTVREWARIQTFPDWFRFAGPRTTGGKRRAGDPSVGQWEREVPKYTQIGNAVPVQMAYALGVHLRRLLGGG